MTPAPFKIQGFPVFGDRARNTGNAGFTLIEILVATAIASIILIMAYASYRSIFLSIKRSIGRAEFYENVNLAIMKIDQDLANAYYTKLNKKINFVCEDDRGNSNLRFTTVMHSEMIFSGSNSTPVRQSDIRGVGYYLKEAKNTQGLFHLIKSEKFNYWDEDETTVGEESLMLPNVVSLKFEFQKGNDWEDNWDSRQNNLFPKSVKTTLVVKNYQAEEEKFMFVTLMNIKEYR